MKNHEYITSSRVFPLGSYQIKWEFMLDSAYSTDRKYHKKWLKGENWSCSDFRSQIKILFAGFITGLSVFLIKFLTCERARRGLGLAPYSIFWNLVLAPPLATYVFPVSKSARSRTRVPPTGVYRFLTAPNGAFTPVVTYKILLIQSFLRSIWLKMSKICLFEALIKPLENV